MVGAEIARYNPADAAAATDAIRAVAGVDAFAARVEAIHTEALAEFAACPPFDSAQEVLEIGSFLRDWSGQLNVWANPEAGAEASRQMAELSYILGSRSRTFSHFFGLVANRLSRRMRQ